MDLGQPLDREITFREVLPCGPEELARNARYAAGLGLRDADEERLGVLNIVASGPSARAADFAQLTREPVLAVNGALGLLLEHGVVPHWWAACDPQALVADFIPDDPPPQTTYLLAHVCHPSVFQKLRGRDVKLWYVGSAPEGHRHTKTACSVTLTVMSLMRQLGWRRFRVWGWDCCFYGDGEHHARDQAPPPDDTRINLLFGGRAWPTTHTWSLEAQDAAHQLAMGDYEVEIVGDGMVGAVIREVRAQMAAGNRTLTLEAETPQTGP